MSFVKLAKTGNIAAGEYPFNVIQIDGAALVDHQNEDGTFTEMPTYEHYILNGYVDATQEEFDTYGVTPGIAPVEEVTPEVTE